jgi:hypothetical protein
MLKKILKISGAALGLLLLAALLFPYLFKGKIIRAVKNYSQSAVMAKIDFNDDVEISFFRSFPSLSIGIRDVRISGVDSFTRDTLLRADNIFLSVNVMSLFGSGPVEVSKVALNQAVFHLKVLESGRANWDIAKPDTVIKPRDTGASNFKLALQELSLKDASLEYDDRSLGVNLLLKKLQHELSGDFTQERFVLHTSTQTPDFNLIYGGVSWFSHVNTDLKADLDMDMKSMRFSFKKGNLALNALTLGAEGFVDLNDTNINMDLRVQALQQDFKSFLSILPGMYQPSFKNMQAAGKLECAAFVKGIYNESSMPAFQVKLNIQDGNFRYPDLPYGAEQIQMALLVDNPDGVADHTRIDLSKFHAVLAGKPLDASLQVKTPVSDPELNAALRGDVDLSRFAGLFPLEAGTKLSGLVHADIRAAGRYSAIEAGRYEVFLAEGVMNLSQIQYSSGAGQPALQLQSLKFDFTPKQVNMPVCIGAYGQSDFNMKGSLHDFIAYALGKSALQGTLDWNSRLLNINEFISASVPSTPAATDTIPLEAIVLPRNLTLGIAMKVDQLIYDNLTLDNVNGNARMEDGRLDLSGLSAGLLGGTIALDGVYDSRNSDNPAAGLNIRATSISIPESFRYFPIIQKFAPVARYAKGLFSADISLNSVFDHLLKPNYQTVDVKGVVRISQAAVEQLDLVKKLSEQMNVPVIQSLDLKNQRFAFKINKGVFSLEDSLDLNLPGGIRMKLGGGSLLDQTLQYGGRMLVPVTQMKTGNPLLNSWQQEAAKKGIQLNTPEQLPLDFSIGGTIMQPLVKVGLRTAANQAAADLKAQAKKQLEIQKAAAEQRAKDSLNQLKIKGEQEAARLRQEATQKLEQEKQAAQLRLQEEKRKAEEEAKRKMEAEKQKLKQQLKDKLKQGGGGN